MADPRVKTGLPPGRASISCLLTWLGRRGDFEKGVDPNSLRGVSKYFNSVTSQGKLNTVIATYLTVGLACTWLYMSSKSTRKTDT